MSILKRTPLLQGRKLQGKERPGDLDGRFFLVLFQFFCGIRACPYPGVRFPGPQEWNSRAWKREDDPPSDPQRHQGFHPRPVHDPEHIRIRRNQFPCCVPRNNDNFSTAEQRVTDEERSRNVKEAGASFPPEQEFRQEKRSSDSPVFSNRMITKIACKINLAGNNILTAGKIVLKPLRRRAIRAISPSRLSDAVADSGTLAVSPEIASALNVGVW